jgi:spore coat protein U-like protein
LLKEKFLLTVMLLIVGVISPVSTVSAATLTPAPTVSVNGLVQSQCGSAVNGVMDISIDPSLTGAQAITITTNATVKCSNQKAVTISASSSGSGLSSAGGTLSGTMKNGGNSINYTLTFNNNITGQGFGSGKDVAILVGGSVAQADAENAVYIAGSYTDTVTLTITY